MCEIGKIEAVVEELKPLPIVIAKPVVEPIPIEIPELVPVRIRR